MFSFQCFVFLISVKGVIIFSIIYSVRVEIFGVVNFIICLELIPIRIGMSWIPIPIRIRVGLNNAIRPDFGFTTLAE